MAEKQVPSDTVIGARGTKRSLVLGLRNRWHRAVALSSLSDSADFGASPFCMDEGGDRDRGAGCFAAECAMVLRNQRIAFGIPAASVRQEAQSHADLEGEQLACGWLQRVSEHDTRRQLSED